MPFGVELPENLGTPPVESPSGDLGSGGDSSNKVSNDSQEPKIPEPTDLDKLERFRFEGREWNRKDFKNAYLMREDYTRKTQELSEARKYSDNFHHDLKTVIANRDRFEEFKKLYPKEYVDRAEEILRQMAPNTPGVAPKQEVDPLRKELDGIKSQLEGWKKEKEETEITQINAWLDNQYQILSKKYPLANTEVITARAEVAASKGNKIDASALEKLFKRNDEEIKAKWEEHYKGKVNKQINAGKEAKDIGSGGGIVGGAPKNFKTIREATAGFLADIGSKG